MAIIGIQLDRTNPEYTIADFTFWMPQFKKYMNTDDGQTMFNNLYPIANNKIFYSIFGTDWKFAMSLCIAHYATLIANQLQNPSGDTLEDIAGGGKFNGIISSASIGGFSKTFDVSLSINNDKESLFWNSTSFGAQLMTLLSTKAISSIAVITSNPVPDRRINGIYPFNRWR